MRDRHGGSIQSYNQIERDLCDARIMIDMEKMTRCIKDRRDTLSAWEHEV